MIFYPTIHRIAEQHVHKGAMIKSRIDESLNIYQIDLYIHSFSFLLETIKPLKFPQFLLRHHSDA